MQGQVCHGYRIVRIDHEPVQRDLIVNKPSRTPGICRIDQPEKHNHGFFVRMQRRGKIHSAFFTDKRHGGRAPALAAAQKHQRKLAAKLGEPVRMSRRQFAQLPRRNNSSGIVGVRRVLVRRVRSVRKYWMATWSPKLHVVAKKAFSVNRYGSRKAKQLAIRARRAGVRSME